MTPSKVSKTQKLYQKTNTNQNFKKNFKTCVKMPHIKKLRKQTIVRNKNINYAILENFKNSKLTPKHPKTKTFKTHVRIPQIKTV